MNATTNRKVLYCRVSTNLQEFDSQRQIVSDYLERIDSEFDIEDLELVEEKLSGDTDMSMRALQTLIDELKDGDTIYVAMLTRFSRNAITGMNALYQCYQKGITVIDCSRGEAIDLSDHNNKVTLFVSLWSAEAELHRIRTAAKSGTKKAKKEGVKYGRANEKYSIDSKTKSEAYIKSSQTRVLSRLNNPMLKTIISAMEIVIPEIKEYALIGSKYPFLGYQKYGRISAEQWERIHDAYGRICGNSPQINKDATIKDLQYLYYYLWKTHFVNAASPFVSYE